jgi:hypothetical protein
MSRGSRPTARQRAARDLRIGFCFHGMGASLSAMLKEVVSPMLYLPRIERPERLFPSFNYRRPEQQLTG